MRPSASRSSTRLRQRARYDRNDARTYERLYGDAIADELFVSIAPHADIARVRDRLACIASPLRIAVRPVGAMRLDAVASFARALSLGAALGAVAIVVAIAGGALTFVALVAERRDDYRMLRIVGLSRAGLRASIAIEAALFATALAVIVAMTLAALVPTVATRVVRSAS